MQKKIINRDVNTNRVGRSPQGAKKAVRRTRIDPKQISLFDDRETRIKTIIRSRAGNLYD